MDKKMKKLGLLLGALLISLSALCDTEYNVTMWTGQVEYKFENTDVWKPIRQGVVLKTSDMLSIPKDGMVILSTVDKKRGIKINVAGKKRINQFILDLKQRSIAAATNENVIRQKSYKQEDYKNRSLAGKQKGASRRGDTYSTREMVQSLCYLANQALSGTLSEPDSRLKLHRFESEEGISFGVENNTDKGLFFNILHVDRISGTAELCYPVDNDSLFLPTETCFMYEEVYYTNSDNDIYLLVATEDPINPFKLNNSLSCKSQKEIQSAELLYKGFIYCY